MRIIVQKIEMTINTIDETGFFPVVKTEKRIDYRIKPKYEFNLYKTKVLEEKEIDI